MTVKVQGWSEDDIKRHEEVFDNLISKSVKASLNALTMDINNMVTAAAWPTPIFDMIGNLFATWTARVEKYIFPYLVNIFVKSAGAVAKDTQRATGIVMPAVPVSYAAQYLSAASNRLVGLGDHIWTDIREQLVLGYDAGESIPQLAARIKDVAEMTEKRAVTIARTEVTSAANQGSLYELLIAGFDDQDCKKCWLATEDERTRPFHVEADGQCVGILQPFLVGGQGLQCPGDPTGRPDNIINCRCTMTFEFTDEVLTASFVKRIKEWIERLHPRDKRGRFTEKEDTPGFREVSVPAKTQVTKIPKYKPAPKWKPTPLPGKPEFYVRPKETRGISGDKQVAPGMYGQFGAAGLMMRAYDSKGTERFLLVQRGTGKYNKYKWQLPGGALDQYETPEQGAARESWEEVGAGRKWLAQFKKRGVHKVSLDVPGRDEPWEYHNIAADAPKIFTPHYDSHELMDARWFTRSQIRALRKHGLLVEAFAKNLEYVFDKFDKPDITTSSVVGNLAEFRWVEEEHPRDLEGQFTDKFDWLSLDDAEVMHEEMTMYDPWTQKQWDGLHDYAGFSYAAINTTLRDEDENPGDFTLGQIEAIHDAMRPTTRAVKVQRGVYADVFEGVKVAEDLEKMIGRTFEEKGFLSTTIDPKFLGGAASRKSGIVHLELHVPENTLAAYLAFENGPGIEAEHELLLDKGTRFVITGVEERDDQFFVIGRVIPHERTD